MGNSDGFEVWEICPSCKAPPAGVHREGCWTFQTFRQLRDRIDDTAALVRESTPRITPASAPHPSVTVDFRAEDVDRIERLERERRDLLRANGELEEDNAMLHRQVVMLLGRAMPVAGSAMPSEGARGRLAEAVVEIRGQRRDRADQLAHQLAERGAMEVDPGPGSPIDQWREGAGG